MDQDRRAASRRVTGAARRGLVAIGCALTAAMSIAAPCPGDARDRVARAAPPVSTHASDAVWRAVRSPVTTTLHGAVMTGPDAGWIVGGEGTILRYDRGAVVSWGSPTTLTLRTVATGPQDSLWAAGDHGTVVRYESGRWEAVDDSPTDVTLRAATAVGDVMYIVGGELDGDACRTGRAMGVLVTGDGRRPWSARIDLDYAYTDVAGYDTRVWIVGGRSCDGRTDTSRMIMEGNLRGVIETWRTTYEEGTGTMPLLGIDFAAAGDGWAVGAASEDANVRRFGGGRVGNDARLRLYTWYDVSAPRPGEAWAVGGRGRLLHLRDDGTSRNEHATRVDMLGIDVVDDWGGLAVGDRGTILALRSPDASDDGVFLPTAAR